MDDEYRPGSSYLKKAKLRKTKLKNKSAGNAKGKDTASDIGKANGAMKDLQHGLSEYLLSCMCLLFYTIYPLQRIITLHQNPHSNPKKPELIANHLYTYNQ